MSAMSEAGSTATWIPVDVDEAQSIQLANQYGQTQRIQPGHHFASPWVEAGLDPNLELQTYISDASKRWLQHPPVVYNGQLAVVAEDNGCDAMEVEVKAQEMLATIQGALPQKMLEGRSLIFKMAKTIVELMRAPADDDLNKELEIDMGKAEACYMVAMNALEEQEKTFSCGMHRAMEKHRSAKWSSEFSINQSHFFGLAGLFSASLFFLPPTMLPFFSHRCYRPASKIGDESGYRLSYSAVPVLSKQANWAYFFGISGFALSTCWAWKRYVAKRERNEATKQQLLAERFSESKRGIAQCKVLWQGVLMAVRRVQTQLSEFKGIGSGRVERQTDALRELIRALHGMLLAMEEFMIHVEACGYFPSNFSVKSLLAKERYHAIHGAMFPTIQDAPQDEAKRP